MFTDCYFKAYTTSMVAPKVEGGLIDNVLAMVAGLSSPSPSRWHGWLDGVLATYEFGLWPAFTGDDVVESEVISLEEVDSVVYMLTAEFP
jgi:hypothetical protein